MLTSNSLSKINWTHLVGATSILWKYSHICFPHLNVSTFTNRHTNDKDNLLKISMIKVFRVLIFNWLCCRFNEKISESFKNNKEVLIKASRVLDWQRKFILCVDAAPSWFDYTCETSNHYKECEGDLLLHWGDKGYKTIFDILMVGANMSCSIVCIYSHCIYKQYIVHFGPVAQRVVNQTS